VSFVAVGDGLVVAAAVGVAVGLGVGFAAGCPAEVVAAAIAEVTALDDAESAGAELEAADDEIGALDAALDVAADAGLDDAALLWCDEWEHPERASAVTMVTPSNPVGNPVGRTRTVMYFPPAGMH
jgi:hypothetical protein